MLTVLLPNGLSAVYGPTSARRNDIDSVNMSHLNDYLLQIQQNEPTKYCVFGDGIFHPLTVFESAIRSYNRPAENAPLTAYQEYENKVFRKLRVSIEHSYADIDNHFAITDVKREWKLFGRGAETRDVLNAKLKLIFFFQNCYACTHGTSASKRYNCSRPTLSEYLGV